MREGVGGGHAAGLRKRVGNWNNRVQRDWVFEEKSPLLVKRPLERWEMERERGVNQRVG